MSLLALAFADLTQGLMDHVRSRGVDDLQLHHFLNVLRFVSADGVRPTHIARQAGITQQAVSLTVADLERRGYIERCADPSDRRAQLVRWAPKGLAIAEEVEAWFGAREEALRERVGDAAVDGAITTLQAMIGAPESR